MNETKHTPWMLGDQMHFASAPDTTSERDRLKAINAELLEALDAALTALRATADTLSGDSERAYAKGCAAIAKAEGR